MECTWDPSKISADVSCSTKNLTCGEIDLSKELDTGASLRPEVCSGLPTKSHSQVHQKQPPLPRAPPTGSLFLGFPLLCKTTKHCLRCLYISEMHQMLKRNLKNNLLLRHQGLIFLYFEGSILCS